MKLLQIHLQKFPDWIPDIEKKFGLQKFLIDDCLFEIPSQTKNAHLRGPKCKHYENRKIAFALLKTFAINDENIMK